MSRRRWSVWLGPPVVLLAVALVFSRFQAGAEAGGRTTPPPAGACAASPIATNAAGKPRREVGPGSWWTISDRLDDKGAMAGRQLAAGRGGATAVTLDLGIESAASGPIGGVVVVTNDDGRRSEIRLVSAVDGCSWRVEGVDDVVRGAILDPGDGSVLAHLVDRETRADLGTWRYGVGAALAKPILVAPPLMAAADDPVWVTDLRLDHTNTTLAVQSCAGEGCLTRVFDLRQPARAPIELKGGQGPLVGWSNGRIITWAACSMLPCSIQQWDVVRDGKPSVVHELAEAAALTPDGRYLLAAVESQAGRTLRIDLATGARALVKGISAGELPIAAGPTATGGFQGTPDEVGLIAFGANPRSFRPSAAEVIP